MEREHLIHATVLTKNLLKMRHPKVDPKQDGEEYLSANRGVTVGHLFWMLEEIPKFVEAGKPGKAMRWLSFIHGVMVTARVSSVNVFREMMRESDEETKDGSGVLG